MIIIDSPPYAASLMQSLRDIGYELDTALADLIDNSITSGADQVHIIVDSTPETKVAIIDNGCGMNLEELQKAMIIGSKSPLVERSGKDLGRFGLGLKTASFSQCKKLTVITKQHDKCWGLCWDLDEVTETNTWSLAQLSKEMITTNAYFTYLQDEDTGTLVLWENCDRLSDDFQTNNEDHIRQKFEEAERHLSLVFHRFLDKSYRSADNLTISINRRKIEFVDPFFSQSPATQTDPVESIRFKESYIEIKGYTLPHHSKCSKEEYEKYSLGSYRDNQGFYVYRSNRLLIFGEWFRLIKKSDLTALTRISLDLPNHFDSEWHIDIKKSHAKPPEQIRNILRKYIDTYVFRSRQVFTSKGHRKRTSVASVWQQYTNKGLKSYEINRNHPSIKHLIEDLDPNLSKRVNDALKLIETSFPVDHLFVEYAASPKSFKTNLTDSEIEEMALQHLQTTKGNLETTVIISFLESAEPYCYYKGNWNSFLKKQENR